MSAILMRWRTAPMRIGSGSAELAYTADGATGTHVYLVTAAY